MEIPRKKLLLPAVVALAALALSTPIAQASVYSGYDKTSREYLGITQTWELWVLISPDLYADINKDGVVDIEDIVIVSVAYRSRVGDPDWNPKADLNGDGIIDIEDIVMVSAHFGEKTQIWTITWKQTGSWPYTSAMYCWYESYVKAWDDKGFSWSWGPDVYPAHGFSGQVTLTYKNTYTWTHTEICWCYMVTAIPVIVWDYVKCRVDIYVGS